MRDDSLCGYAHRKGNGGRCCGSLLLRRAHHTDKPCIRQSLAIVGKTGNGGCVSETEKPLSSRGIALEVFKGNPTRGAFSFRHHLFRDDVVDISGKELFLAPPLF